MHGFIKCSFAILLSSYFENAHENVYMHVILKWKLLLNSEIVLWEYTIRSNKWAICSAFRPQILTHVKISCSLEQIFHQTWQHYYYGYFHIDKEEKTNPNFDIFCDFCDVFSLSNLVYKVQDYTYFTKTYKLCIDLILTNKKTFLSNNQSNR